MEAVPRRRGLSAAPGAIGVGAFGDTDVAALIGLDLAAEVPLYLTALGRRRRRGVRERNIFMTTGSGTPRRGALAMKLREGGLSGELAAVALEAGLALRYRRVCVEDTLPCGRA